MIVLGTVLFFTLKKENVLDRKQRFEFLMVGIWDSNDSKYKYFAYSAHTH